jgi:hypothetical protein
MLNLFKWLSFALSFVYFAVVIVYTGYSATYSPIKDVYLFNKQGGLYQSQDLQSTDLSVGEIKQEVYRWFNNGLNFNYVSFSKNENYKTKVSNNRSGVLPDTRDYLKPYFTEKGYVSFIGSFMSEPLFRGFWRDRKSVSIHFTSPMYIKDSLKKDHVNHLTKRLEYNIQGFFYLLVNAEGTRTKRYKYDFEILLVRVAPKTHANREGLSYFGPMISKNLTGFKIDSFTWNTSEK